MKKSLKAARANSILLRYIYVLLASAIFLGLLAFGVYMINLSTKQKIDDTLKDLKVQSVQSGDADTKYQALKSQVNSAKTVFDSEIKYSNILTKLAAALPEGVILEKISLNQADFTKSTNLSFYAKSSDLTNTLHSKLLASGLFSNVTMGKSEASFIAEDYSIKISIDVVFNKGVSQ